MTDPDVCDELARMFAIGLHNTILHWSPDTVVLGGSLITGSVITPTPIRKHLLAIMKIFTESPHIREATLGDLGGLWGSFDLTGKKFWGYSKNLPGFLPAHARGKTIGRYESGRKNGNFSHQFRC